MRVGIDLDNVTYPFVKVFGDYLSSALDKPRGNFLPARRWEFYEDWGLSYKAFREHYKNAVDGERMFVEGAPMEGAVETIDKLIRDGHSIHFVTDRSVGNKAKASTEKWLEKWGIDYDSLTFASDKTIVKVDVALDDKPSHVDAWRDIGVQAFVYDCGREDQARHPWLIRGWDEFYEIVRMSQWGTVTDLNPTDKFARDFAEAEAKLFVQHFGGAAGEGGKVWTRNEHRVVNEATGGEKGQKLARTDLLPAGPLWKLAEHYGKGGAKYADRNWERGTDWSLNYAAALRHLLQFWNGEDVDAETGSLHVIAAAWHCFALAEFFETHPELDDRIH